jgi:thioredoxin
LALICGVTGAFMPVIRACSHCGQKNRVSGKHLADTGRCGACKSALSPVAEPLAADKALFDEIVKDSPVPVLVDFWAEWCGPCKMIGPALEELAGEFAGKLTVAKVDIDNNPMSPNQFAVRGIPTLMLFKDGKPAATQVGALPKSKLKDWIAGNI